MRRKRVTQNYSNESTNAVNFSAKTVEANHKKKANQNFTQEREREKERVGHTE